MDQDWKKIHDTVAREQGVFTLARRDNHQIRCEDYLRRGPVDGALDLIDVSFHHIDTVARHVPWQQRKNRGITMNAPAAIEELNTRFRRAGVGYQFEAGL